MDEKKPKKKGKYHPIYVGAFLAVIGMVVFILGFRHGGAEFTHLLSALGLAVGVGLASFFLYKKQLRVWFVSLVGGYLFGLTSALEFLVGPEVLNGYYVALLTTLFFTVIGFVFGVIVEFIRLLHYVIHGGIIRRYPGSFSEESEPESKADKSEVKVEKR
jgi:hypothetical protein